MLDGIKNNLILKIIIQNISQKICLKLFKYSKKFKNKLNIDKKEYKTYLQIEVELKLVDKEHYYNDEIKFINYIDGRSNYHIYLDNEKNEIQRNYITKEENVSKIKVIIDKNVKKLNGLFSCRDLISEISFIKFNRKE